MPGAVDGFWGPVDALHTFCEPSYAFASSVAELWNAVSSLLYVAVAAENLRRLRALRQPLHWRVTVGWWSLVVTGSGSCLFHATMRYHMELLDELPMLVLAAAGSLQVSDLHPLGQRRLSGSISLLDAWFGSLTSVGAAVYLITHAYFVFVGCFAIGCLVLAVLMVTMDSSPMYGKVGIHAIMYISLGAVVWQAELLLCPRYPWIWPLHNVWHLASCVAAAHMFLVGYLYRIDKCSVQGILAAAPHESSPLDLSVKLPLLLFTPSSAYPMLANAAASRRLGQTGGRQEGHPGAIGRQRQAAAPAGEEGGEASARGPRTTAASGARRRESGGARPTSDES